MIAALRPRRVATISLAIAVASFALLLLDGFLLHVPYLGWLALLAMLFGFAGIVFSGKKREPAPSQTTSNPALFAFLIAAALVAYLLYNWALNLPPA